MATLSIENLGSKVGLDASVGDLQGRVGEAQVLREMQKQGLELPSEAPREVTFTGILEKSLDDVNLQQKQADDAIKELVAGRSKNIHETMLTIERADASLKMAMQVRNKILEAYREIMRMQV
jgi:flagellar hook-basal body complex protein FliE